MYEQILVVKYIPEKNCFLHLPQKLQKQYFIQGTCLNIKHETRTFYLTCSPSPLQESVDDSYGSICGLNSIFAKSMGIKEGDPIVCSLISHSGSLKSIHIVPFTNEDWDLLETNANKIQEVFMDQVRVVCNKQVLTLWPSRTLNIKFKVVNLDPNVPMGYLENDTQVIVIHPDEKINFDNKSINDTWTFTQFFKKQFYKKHDVQQKDDNMLQELEILFKKFNKTKYDIYRTMPVKILQLDLNMDYYIIMDKSILPQNHKPSNVYQVQKVSACNKFIKKDESIPKNIYFYVKLCSIDNLIHDDKNVVQEFLNNSPKSTSLISEDICEILNLNLGDRIVLETVKECNELESIELNYGIKNQNYDTTDLLNLFKQYVLERSTEYKVLIPNKIMLKLKQCDFNVQVNLKPDELMYAEINAEFFSKVLINVVFKNFNELNDAYKFDDYNFGIQKLCMIKGFACIVDKCVKDITEDFIKFKVPQNVLIEGAEGTGKTSLLKSISQKLSQSPYYYHVKIFNCKNLKGRRCENVLNDIGNILYETLQKSPSIIMFDDLEHILKAPEAERDAPDSILMHNRLSDMFFNLLSLCQNGHQVCAIGTCQSTRMLNPRIYSARGCHLFSEVYKVPDLDKDDRIKLMQHLLKQEAYMESNLNWPNYSEVCEGFVMQDFADFAQRTTFYAWKSKSNSKSKSKTHLLTINEDIIMQALADTRPLGVKTSDGDSQQTITDVSDTWNAIGGLEDVKEQLLELVKWPSLYPKVFMNAPITLSRGVLLYGPPGCGKTLLGTILSRYCKLRLIRVRGPELLGKYAGESERQVREVFKRAHSARPCILFFDEFDSLAPRRGHDTSGVSDRVVNQLLTELDGCEARDVLGGVFILAATSRPDLIDPALLRPGRLDPQFLCPIPDCDRRFDILKSLTVFNKKLEISSQEENQNTLQEIAEKSAGFTGADLSALLCKAKEFAIENNQQVISKDDLMMALSTTRPSLSIQERQKYEIIYNRFTNSSAPETGTVVLTKRATFA